MKLDIKTPCSLLTILSIIESEKNYCNGNTVYLDNEIVDLTSIRTNHFNLYSNSDKCLRYNITLDTELDFEVFNLVPRDDTEMNIYLGDPN